MKMLVINNMKSVILTRGGSHWVYITVQSNVMYMQNITIISCMFVLMCSCYIYCKMFYYAFSDVYFLDVKNVFMI